jgi:hypothetical protein
MQLLDKLNLWSKSWQKQKGKSASHELADYQEWDRDQEKIS